MKLTPLSQMLWLNMTNYYPNYLNLITLIAASLLFLDLIAVRLSRKHVRIHRKTKPNAPNRP